MQKVQELISKLDSQLAKHKELQKIENMTRIKNSYLVIALGTIFSLMVLLNLWACLLTDLLGFMYPAYASFKAIESKRTDDDVQWLTYWVVFGLFKVIEFFTDLLLHYIPFYYAFKAVAILYLVLPTFNGATVLYKSFLRPWLVVNESQIDKEIEKIKKSVLNSVDELKKDS